MVHGLNGHRKTAWTTSNGDLLPHDLSNARIYVRIYSWGYHVLAIPLSYVPTLVLDVCLERQVIQVRSGRDTERDGEG